MAKPIFAAKEAKKVNVFGADVYLTMPRAAGRTEVSLLDATAHPGDGPPLHVHHNEDEISRVLKGRFRLRIGPGRRCANLEVERPGREPATGTSKSSTPRVTPIPRPRVTPIPRP
jgi:hypothetical protein